MSINFILYFTNQTYPCIMIKEIQMENIIKKGSDIIIRDGPKK